uniref:Rho-GAP domain-containing protein n=1 Tax=Esox lucius TaxID=8010 RepID=A0A6Q2XK10_ESOLU
IRVFQQNIVRVFWAPVVKHLRVVHGIKLKHYQRKKERPATTETKVFGVSLGSLRQCYAPDYGQLPCFLVDACEHLLQHAGTEGLFRKSGSVVRLKRLRASLDKGEACLSTALPCDVAGLLKMFCRELRDPLVPSDLQLALLKAQLLPSVQERTSAALLVSCLLPDRNTAFLRYIFHFLSKVSSRSAENQMTSSNLAVIFAPSLLPFSQRAEGVETSLKLKAAKAVVHTFIENAPLFGMAPHNFDRFCFRLYFSVEDHWGLCDVCRSCSCGDHRARPRNESGNVGCFSARKLKGSEVLDSPSLFGLVKLKLTPWKNRRRATL